MPTPGSPDCPLEVAIVGSGPSGFYAAEALLRSDKSVRVCMIERLPVPYGLVRSGVAPDHPKLKSSALVYDRIARSENFRFFGNVCVGRDICVSDLREAHHAVIFAYGASLDRKLGIPGEELSGVHSATQFVGWYNGHPDFRDIRFDLSGESAAIIGQGNVALDVARILTKSVDDLRHTDISAHALDALSESRVREVHIFGRRGPVQAKFTSQELAEFGKIDGLGTIVDPDDLALRPACRIEIEDQTNRNYAKNISLLHQFSQARTGDHRRRLYFHFFRNPASLHGKTRLETVRFNKTRLSGEPFHQVTEDIGETLEFPCQILFRSVGYRGAPLEDLPFDRRSATLAHVDGRLCGAGNHPEYGLYATGWIKRGPSGVIGTNRADSVASVETLLSDLDKLPQHVKPGAEALEAKLKAQRKTAVSFKRWDRIDLAERARGQSAGKPREKFTSIEDMLDACGLSDQAAGA